METSQYIRDSKNKESENRNRLQANSTNIIIMQSTRTYSSEVDNESTLDAIIEVIEDWEKALDNNEKIHAVFYDFAKAFDLVDHNVLMKKLDKLLPKWMTSWIAQYLTDRKQWVKLKNLFSSWESVVAGVIQGSVLGPILFVLFILDINEYLIPQDANLSKYADDLKTHIIFTLLQNDTTQDTVDAIVKWCFENKMSLNVDKTKDMVNSRH